jgi:hypothetical protein
MNTNYNPGTTAGLENTKTKGLRTVTISNNNVHRLIQGYEGRTFSPCLGNEDGRLKRPHLK